MDEFSVKIMEKCLATIEDLGKIKQSIVELENSSRLTNQRLRSLKNQVQNQLKR